MTQGNWRFPEGSVLARTVSIEQEPGKPASRRRVETQILHLEADAWRPYSYVWNDDQTDAVLADAAGRPGRSPCKVPGGRRERNYRVHARAECVLCHNPWVEKKTTVFGVQSASPLGVNTPQLNRTLRRRRSRRPTSSRPGTSWGSWPGRPTSPSCRSWSIPTTSRPISIAGRGRICKRTVLTATSSTRGARPISRWDTMCRWSRPRPSVIRPIQGTFKSPEPGSSRPAIRRARCCITGCPSSAAGACRGSARRQVDERATRMIHDWIARMPQPKTGTAAAEGRAMSHPKIATAIEALAPRRSARRPTARSAAIGRLASSTRGALMLLGTDRSGTGASESLRREVVAITRNSPLGRGPRPVRAVHSRARASQAAGRRGRPSGDPGAAR